MNSECAAASDRAIIERVRSGEINAFADGPAWQAGVMAEIRRIGPLKAKSPGRVYEPAPVWSWAAAVAACLVIGIAGYALSDLHTDAVMAGLFLDDPAGLTVTMMLVEM